MYMCQPTRLRKAIKKNFRKSHCSLKIYFLLNMLLAGVCLLKSPIIKIHVKAHLDLIFSYISLYFHRFSKSEHFCMAVSISLALQRAEDTIN